MLLTDAEKEILILQATLESISSMVNYNILKLNHRDPDSSVVFKTDIHQQYFNILLLDFLHANIFEVKTDCLTGLQIILANPQFGGDITSLKTAAWEFITWLDHDVEYEHEEESRKLWFPTIDTEIALRIKRSEFIKICGNISKHNSLGLDRQAKVIQDIFTRNNINIELTQALLIMEEFYEQFHVDLFTYHASTIAEFLNNIRWGIYEYLIPLHKASTEYYWDDAHKMRAWKYNAPPNIINKFIKTIFWNLMSDVHSKPCVPKFTVTRYLKIKY